MDNKKKNLYSSGQFAEKAGVSLRTIRYYDKKNILKPSYRTESGARYYSDQDFTRLQQILLWKYLGFSLDEIREMTLAANEKGALLGSLGIQKKLVEERIWEMEDVARSIDNLYRAIEGDRPVEWDQMVELIHKTAMERSLTQQYKSAANISARIRLHHDFSRNKEGWFHWIFRQCGLSEGMKVLEVGCGNGALWFENAGSVPEKTELVLSDISGGMVHDAQRQISKAFAPETSDSNISFRVIDCQHIPFPENCFDMVIANHVFFYCNDVEQAVRECSRVLKPGGKLVCSTYGSRHMKEITDLVQDFDPEIVLAAEKLDAHFGKENGQALLRESFTGVQWIQYDDSIEIDQSEPLIAYILSCHGNQNRRLLDRFKEFRSYVDKQVQGGFHITKDAGVFVCSK